MICDYHVHTPLCRHAEGAVAEYLRAAEGAGLDELGFADHAPWPPGYDPKYRMSETDFPLYRSWIRELQATGSPVTVRYGIEADWVPGRMDEVRRHLADEPFDYVLGSIHYTDDLPFDDPPNAWRWREPAQVDRVWRRYAELMLAMVNDGFCDIIAHCDLPKKFGWRPADDTPFMTLLDETLRVAGAKGMALEINTAGLRKPVGEIYPAPAILRRACAHGVGLALGSDAHAPADVAADFPRAIELARATGFREIRTYQGRQFTGHRI